MKTIRILVLSFSLLLIGLGSANAQSSMMKGQMNPSMCPMWNSLSSEQQDQVNSIRLAGAKRIEALRTELGKKRIELMELNMASDKNDSAIQKKEAELNALRDQMRSERRDVMKQIHSYLNKDSDKRYGKNDMNQSSMGCPMCQGCAMRGKMNSMDRDFHGQFRPGYHGRAMDQSDVPNMHNCMMMRDMMGMDMPEHGRIMQERQACTGCSPDMDSF